MVFLGFDIGHVIYRRLALDACDKVSYTAHIGGALAGLLLGVILLRNIHRLKWERVLQWIGLGMVLRVMLIAIIMTIVIKPGGDALLSTRCVSSTQTPK